MADAPVPTTATRLPVEVVRVVPARRVEDAPPKFASSPGSSGTSGSLSAPEAITSTSAR
jgi:hypothetical protein